jgi:N-acetylglutamate synthase-like GNAT family acetyltransferase
MHPAVREARESDLERIRELIVDLATYERAAHEVKTTTEQLRTALFGAQPAAYALVAEGPTSKTSTSCRSIGVQG